MKDFHKLREDINTQTLQEKNWSGHSMIKGADKAHNGTQQKHDGIHHFDFAKGEKAHPKVMASAKKHTGGDHSIDHVKLKDGHSLQTHAHDDADFIHIHHIHNGEHKGTYKYNTPHEKRDKHPGDGAIKSSLKHAPPHVVKAASQHLNNKEDEQHGD